MSIPSSSPFKARILLQQEVNTISLHYNMSQSDLTRETTDGTPGIQQTDAGSAQAQPAKTQSEVVPVSILSFPSHSYPKFTLTPLQTTSECILADSANSTSHSLDVLSTRRPHFETVKHCTVHQQNLLMVSAINFIRAHRPIDSHLVVSSNLAHNSMRTSLKCAEVAVGIVSSRINVF